MILTESTVSVDMAEPALYQDIISKYVCVHSLGPLSEKVNKT